MRIPIYFFPNLQGSLWVQRITALLVLTLLTLLPAEVLGGHLYQALLRGRHEVLPVVTPAHGIVNITLDGNTITVAGTFSGLSSDFDVNIAGGSHIHLAYAGQNGGIQFRLNAELDADLRGGRYLAADNTFTLSDDQLQALRDRRLYVNIHTADNRGGELRGQILPAGKQYFFSNLLGSNEVPAVCSQGSGALAVELSGNELVVSGSFRQLEGDLATDLAGGAHLHLGFAGQNGPVIIPLRVTTDGDLRQGVFRAADNTFTLSPQQVQALALRRIYANVHSSFSRSGELRGQVLGMARTVFRAHLAGGNEVPAVMTMASGVVMAELMADNRLIVSGSFDGLESKFFLNLAGGVHIHRGMAGQNGPIMFRLFPNLAGNLRAGTFRANRNTVTVSAAQADAMYARRFYVNIHSIRRPGGEIRGQLLPESQVVLNGFLSSIFEPGGQISTAQGGVKVEVMGNRMTLSGSFSDLTTPLATQIRGGAHIHRAMAGSNGPIVFPLTATQSGAPTDGVFAAADNKFEIDDTQWADLKARRLYVNVHSGRFPPGEIRSQLLPEARLYMVAPLSGASETDPVRTDASGMVILEVNGARGNTASGSFNNLSTPLATFIAGGAHIHGGLAGENGGVIHRLNSMLSDDQMSGVFPAAANTFEFDQAFISRLRRRATYANVHSDRYRPGEIRGQFLPLATAYLTATLAGMNEVQPKATGARGQTKAELHGNTLVVTGAFEGLIGDFATAVAGGSHLHRAAAGSNGPIQVSLNADLDADLRGGRYQAAENTYSLTDSQVDDLIGGNYYHNIHTLFYRSGELRGQLLGELNFFPSDGAEIQSPASGTALVIEGDAATQFTVNWSAASDRDLLAYLWQLSAGEDFSTLLVNQNVGNDLSFSTDYATIDALLAGAGVAGGESITLYHRAVASDGSLRTPGPTASVVLTRGGLEGVALRQAVAGPAGSTAAFRVFPNLVSQVQQEINVSIAVEREQGARLVLITPLGQVVQEQSLDLSAGQNQLRWQLPRLAAGYYFIQLQLAQELIPLQRLVVE